MCVALSRKYASVSPWLQALPHLTPDNLVAVLRWAILGGAHPLPALATSFAFPAGGGFAAEAPLPLRVAALAAGVAQLQVGLNETRVHI